MRALKTMLVAVCCLFVLLAHAAAQSLPPAAPQELGFSPERLERISSWLRDDIAKGTIPGAVLMIVRHGKVAHFEAAGSLDPDTKAPMTKDAIFRIYSMTKPIVSVAVMMLAEQGRIKLEDPIAKYIPAFKDMKVGVETSVDGKPKLELVAARRPITIQDLLRHSSGLTYGFFGDLMVKKLYLEADLRGDYDNAEFVDRLAKLPLAFQPGSTWDYSHSTDVLGRLVEVVSGKSLYQFLKQRIFSPLGMTSTKFVLEGKAEWARMAEPLPADGVLRLSESDRRAHPEWESGGGGLVSTTTDYARFSQMLLNGGKLDGRTYLGPAAFKQMTTDHIGPGSGVERDYFYFPGDGFGYGYGLAVRTDPGNAKPPPAGSIGELKWDSGSGTYFGVDPKLDMFYIMMEQTQTERSRILPIFKKLVYDAFEK